MTVTLDTLTLTGTRASYSVVVDATGAATLDPLAGGAPITGSGVAVIQFSDVSMFALNKYDSEVALLYGAALAREPDVGGLETWIGIYNNLPVSVQSGGVYASLAETSGGFNGSMSIADGFVNSAEFQAKYGALTDQGYVTQLYANVLHRAPDQSGLTTWMTALTPVGQTYVDASGVSHGGLGETRAYVLVGFAESAENNANCAAASTTTNTAGWLINTSLGGYTDSGASVGLSPNTVLSQGEANNYINTSLIAPSDVNSSTNVTVGGEIITGAGLHQSGGVVVENGISVSDNNITVILSSTINSAAVGGTNDIVYGAVGGGSTISAIIPNNNAQIFLSGTGNTVDVGSLGPVSTPFNITGFTSGDVIQYGGQAFPCAAILSGPVNGASLTFTNNSGSQYYAIDLGNVGNGSAATVAAAANLVYKVAGVPWEAIVFFGDTNSGNTIVWEWNGNTAANTSAGTYPWTTGADTNGNHLVDASELTAGVTLVGVHSSSLVAGNFH